MTEKDYIQATNLARVRDAKSIMANVLSMDLVINTYGNQVIELLIKMQDHIVSEIGEVEP